MKKTIIECGANRGTDTDHLLKKWDDSVVYAIEPTHELLYNYLYPKFKNNNRVKVFPFAVDIENGFKQFNIAGQSDWGCSSLNSFTDEIENIWMDRPDFKMTHSYYVPTITLKSFCVLYNIDVIDYLWIDTQGHDYKVLTSLGDKIEHVVAGKCEVAMNIELYKNTQNTLKIVKPWLINRGFKVEIAPDATSAECDLHFSR